MGATKVKIQESTDNPKSNKKSMGIRKNKKFKNSHKRMTKGKIKKFRKKETDTIDKTKLKKYERGNRPDIRMVKVKMEQKRIAKREKKIEYGLKQSVRSEVLLTEDSGFLEADEGENSAQITQSEIKDSVDLLSASKRFELQLTDFGPYRMNYSRNGRFLLLGGKKGHVATLDWIRKKLLCEINVMESVHDVSWLHQETLFAVAQKKWVYIYDNQGVEIHCIKKLYNVVRMMFLPYHFLLATVGDCGFISWLDVSVGQMVEQFRLKSRGTASSVAVHPGNAMICVGEPGGTISFYGPNSKKPAIIKWCHKSPVCSIAFDPKGTTLTTAGIDKTVKIWDARNLKGPLQDYIVRSAPNCMSMSQRGMLAFGLGNVVEIYNDTMNQGIPEKKVYLRHKVPSTISNMEFCPFEDILGVGHSAGFDSMLVPGSGEPNFDALEINPFQTKSQRKEAEVKALLSKIPSDLITWDSTELRKLDIPSLEEIIEAKKQLAHIKPPNIQFVPRNKKGKQSGSVKAVQRKNIMKEDFRRNYVKQMRELKEDENVKKPEKNETPPSTSVLDRFVAKSKN